MKPNVVASLRSKWRLALRPASLTATISATAALQFLGGERSKVTRVACPSNDEEGNCREGKTPPYSSRASVIILPFASPRIRYEYQNGRRRIPTDMWR